MRNQPQPTDQGGPPPAAERDSGTASLIRKHLRFGWGMLLVFLVLGMVLEGLHAFKVGEYLNPSAATRRLMWTLAHAHGTLLGLLNLAFAFSLGFVSPVLLQRAGWASVLLRGATLLLPLGFLLGGFSIAEGDPGIGIALVPLGAALLLGSVLLTWAALR